MPNNPSNCAADLVMTPGVAAKAVPEGAQYATDAARHHPAAARRRRLAENVFRATFGLGLALGAGHAWAQSPPVSEEAALRADCDAAVSARVLHPQVGPAAEARAYWLDRGLIQWPGASAEGRFRLYHSATAALRAEAGKPVRGADGVIGLTVAKAELPKALAERFKFIGAGPRLALPEGAVVAQQLREQMLLVREDAHGLVLATTALQTPGALDDLYAAAETATLGAFRYGRQDISEDFATRFALWAPTARHVAVCARTGDAQTRAMALPARRDDTSGVWTLDLPGALHGMHYAYLIDVYVPGVGIVRNRVTDPYSVGLTTDSKRSVVLDLDAPDTKPDGWDAASRPAALTSNTDLSIYELHVRDFSRDDASVRAAWRGKYLAFTEDDSNGMRHLRAMAQAGMTDVHLLPTYDLSTVPETGCITPQIPNAAPDSEAQQAAVAAVASKDCFNWGYDPFHYDVPEGSYAIEPNGAARIREFRTMVQALHGAGLRVGLDVVYNHTFASGQDEKSVLDRIVPGYYHRLDAAGKLERSTCCENTATEHRMMAKLMIDSAAHWVKHYRIDSFRFDLMGHQPRAAMERLQRAVDEAAGRRVQLIGEGWNFGEIANGARFVQASQLSLQNSGIATFSDRARDALRGGGCCDSGEGMVANQGWLNGLHDAPNDRNLGKDRRAELLRSADLARIGLAGTLREVRMLGADGVEKPLSQFDYAGQPAGYAAEPGEVVNYVENHDNMTLFDLNALRLPRETSREDRARVQLLGVATTALSQGVAYYHAGIEILRSKSLDKNSFDSGDGFNRLDWTYTDNGFGAGLPPQRDNGKDWPLLKPVLADASIKPTPREIAWMRDAFNDLLKIRASSTLFRMRSAADVGARLSFRNVGSAQNPLVLAVHLNGGRIAVESEHADEIAAGEAIAQTERAAPYPGAGFREILYFINTSPEPQTLTLTEERGKRYRLHPEQASAQAADKRPVQQARYDERTGKFKIPARTTVVYVVE
jgi:pullulanase